MTLLPDLRPHDARIAPGYSAAAIVAGAVVLISYVTAQWQPWLVTNPGSDVSRIVASLLVGPAAGLVMAGVPALGFRWPAFATALAALPLVITVIDPLPIIHFGVFATLWGLVLTTSWRRPRASLTIAALTGLLVVAWVLSGIKMVAPFGAAIDPAFGGGPVWLVVSYLVVTAAVAALGLRLRAGVVREEQRRLLLARESEVGEQSAVVAERARLARDLHDVVAHHVSLIAVRAETAPYTEPDLGGGGVAVLAEVASEARLALDELRGVLGILGRSGADDADRSPQPTLADVDALAERARRSGQEVRLAGDIQVPVPAAAGYAAYRVVQEALTNARRHAPGAVVDVDIAATDRLLEVVVANPAPDGPRWQGGRGLAGMRERVEALGGRLVIDVAGPRFVVRASLPIGGIR